MIEWIIIIIAALMGLIDYFGHKISGLASYHRAKILSFSSGALVSLFFLILIPDLIAGNNPAIDFFYVLIGFMTMHLIEKYFYRHETDKQKLLEDLKIAHIVGFGIDNFLVGLIIESVLSTDFSVVFFISIPLGLQMLTSSLSLDSIDIRLNDRFSKIILSILPVLGALFGFLLEAEFYLTRVVLAFALGVLLYMIARDVIPQGKEGSPPLFILGALISAIIWFTRLVF